MPPTPEQLRRLALAARARAELLMRQAEVYARAADELEGLQVSGQASSLVTMDMVAHGIATSAGRSEDPLVAAANKAGFTVRTLAAKVGRSHASLSMARNGKRSIPRAIADQIEKLTGFAATAKNWPGGLS